MEEGILVGKGQLGEEREVRLSGGTVRYREIGEGEPVVFVHGLLVHGGLWGGVVPRLSGSFRCIVPDWPLGAHGVAMEAGADLSFGGMTRIVVEFLDALGLRGVTLVGNDTGGAICQSVVASYPERVHRLVLTNCDAFENFLPPVLRYVQWGAHVPGFVSLMSAVLRVRALRRLPITFGWLTRRPIEDRVLDSYLAPLMQDARVRRDLGKFLRDVSPRRTLAVAEKLPGFGGPVLLAWAPEDKLFRFEHAERLAARFPNATIRRVPDSRAFVPEDAPDRLAQEIEAFLQAQGGGGVSARDVRGAS